MFSLKILLVVLTLYCFIFLVSCAPPVGCYDVTKANSKSSGPVTFEKGGRFVENKGKKHFLS